MKRVLQSIALLLGMLMLPASTFAQDIYADVNGDLEVNIGDINAVIDVILSNVNNPSADVNGDSEINIADINAVIDIILGGGAPNQDNHEFVDLCLPSGTLWATCNIGASAPEEYGDYFAWGETEPKDDYAWGNYKWFMFYEGVYLEVTKYCTEYSEVCPVDGKTELDLEDDAAYMNWGPSWRMPTLEQLQELLEECIWQWTQRNGVNGYLVIGMNGNSIFLPAAGGFTSYVYYDGECAYYWSRTLCSSDKLNLEDVGELSAYILSLDSGYKKIWFCTRYEGQTIRAVRATQN